MLFEEVPDCLTEINKIVSPIMAEILNRIQDHFGSLAAIAPPLLADQDIMGNVDGLRIAAISFCPGSSPLRDAFVWDDTIGCTVDSEYRNGAGG